MELRNYVKRFKLAADKTEKEPGNFVEGRWCWWCKAKSVCPLKTEKKLEEAKFLFTAPIL